VSDEKKNEKNEGTQGQQTPESPFVSSKKKREEILEKLRAHNYGDRSTNPDIPTRPERESEAPPPPPAKKGESVISQMRKASRAIDQANKNSPEESSGALIFAPKVAPTSEENEAETTEIAEKIEEEFCTTFIFKEKIKPEAVRLEFAKDRIELYEIEAY